jgi:hypothetical protein
MTMIALDASRLISAAKATHYFICNSSLSREQ